MMTMGDEVGKLFVGGLSNRTTAESMKAYFSKYSEVIDCVVMKDPSGRSRCFGFVKFKDPNAVNIVLASCPHVVDSKKVDPKECAPRNQVIQRFGTAADRTKRKVFIGGIPQNASENDVSAAFSQFGGVTEVVFMMDQERGRCRGFGFVTFASEDCVDRAVSSHYVQIKDKMVEIKRAEPRTAGGGGGPMSSHSQAQNIPNMHGYGEPPHHSPYSSWGGGQPQHHSYGGPPSQGHYGAAANPQPVQSGYNYGAPNAPYNAPPTQPQYGSPPAPNYGPPPPAASQYGSPPTYGYNSYPPSNDPYSRGQPPPNNAPPAAAQPSYPPGYQGPYQPPPPGTHQPSNVQQIPSTGPPTAPRYGGQTYVMGSYQQESSGYGPARPNYGGYGEPQVSAPVPSSYLDVPNYQHPPPQGASAYGRGGAQVQPKYHPYQR